MTDLPRYVVVGGGRMGREHYNALRSVVGAGESIAVIDSDPEVHDFWRKAGVQCSVSLDGLDTDRVRLAVLAVPVPAMPGLVSQVARRGLTCLIEKPCAFSLRDFSVLEARIDSVGAEVYVGYWRRFSPAFVRLKEAVLRGDIGTPRMVLACQWDSEVPALAAGPVDESGGIGLDCGVHESDSISWLGLGDLREPLRRTPATGSDLVGDGDTDQMSVTAVTDRGVLAAVNLSRTAGGDDEIFYKIIGERGSVEAHLGSQAWLRMLGRGGTERRIPLAGGSVMSEGLRGQARALVLGDGKQDLATMDDARRAIRAWTA